MLLVGGLLLAVAVRSLWFGFISTTWPQVDAVITRSQAHTPGHGPASSYFELRYEFDCGTERCVGERWRYKLGSNTPNFFTSKTVRVETLAASYPIGTRVKIAVEPSFPAAAVLEPGVSGDDLAFAAFGAAFVLIACSPALLSPVTRKSPPAGPAAVSAGTGGARNPEYAPGQVRKPGYWRLPMTAGAVLLIVSAYPIYHRWSASAWPTVQGKVLYSRMNARGNPPWTYHGVARYEYIVAGRRLLGDADYIGSHEWVASWIGSLQAGSPVVVHYRPSDTAESEIMVEIMPRQFVIPVLAMLLIGLGVILQRAACSYPNAAAPGGKTP